MAFSIVKMMFDPTGVAVANRVVNEDVVIPDVLFNRVVALHHGTFYSENLTMRMLDGTPLAKWVDYRPVCLYTEIMDKTDKTPCCFIQIINTKITGRAVATYNAVGHPYNYARQDLVDILAALQNDKRPYYWDNLLDKPTAYPPLPHVLDLKDTTNWADSIGAMTAFGNALKNIKQLPDLKTLSVMLNQLNTTAKTRFNTLETTFRNHEKNVNNPHANTISKIVGLSNVNNYAMASREDMANKLATRYLSPGVLNDYLTNLLGVLFSEGVHRDKLPMLRVGEMNDNPLPITFSGWSLTCGDVPVMMDRNEYTLPRTVFNLSGYANKTVYLYARLVEHVIQYHIDDAIYAEISTRISLGRIVVGASAISSVAVSKISGIDFYRTSVNVRGSAITATSGQPTGAGTYAWRP